MDEKNCVSDDEADVCLTSHIKVGASYEISSLNKKSRAQGLCDNQYLHIYKLRPYFEPKVHGEFRIHVYL